MITRVPCLFFLLSALAAAQCAPAPGVFANHASTEGCALNIQAGMDSSANVIGSLLQDNVASATLGAPLGFTLSNQLGGAGQALAVVYNEAAPSGPITLGGAPMFLNLAVPLYTLIDGTGLLRQPPDLFASHPGPGALFALNVAVPELASLHGSCFTFQALLFDPSASLGIRLSNALSLGLYAAPRFLATNHGAEGSSVPVSAAASGTGQLRFEAFDPLDGGVPPLTTTLASGIATVPLGARSGPVGYADASTPGVVSSGEPDDIESFFAVTDPQGLLPNQTPGALVPRVSPHSGRDRWVSLTAVLANGSDEHGWSFPVTAGDVVDVECYSLDAGGARILDGYGRGLNPLATAGFDPFITLEHGANVLPLTFDAGSSGPFAVHADDDSGPGGNARLRFQVRAADTLNLRVRSASSSSFASGRYLLNLRVRSGGPAIDGFRIGGSAANVALPGETVVLTGPTLFAGQSYELILQPAHGFTADVLLSGLAATVNGELSFTMPSFGPQLAVGVQRVRLRDQATGETSLRWPTAAVRQPGGILPEVLVLRAPNPQGFPSQGQTSTLVPNIASVQGSGPAGTVGGLFSFTASPGQRIYVEMLALDPNSNGRLVDSLSVNSNPVDYVHNPQLLLWDANAFPTLLASNDEDGVIPDDFGWPGGGGVGIGWSAALSIQASPSFNPATYLLSAAEGLPLGPGFFPRTALLQLVVR